LLYKKKWRMYFAITLIQVKHIIQINSF